MIVVFNDAYQNSLNPIMQGRYATLRRDLVTGNLPAQGSQSFRERLEVLEEVRNIRTGLRDEVGEVPLNPIDGLNLGQRNIAYGTFEITLPGGTEISEEFISIAGSRTARTLRDNFNLDSFEGRAIMPEPQGGARRRFPPLPDLPQNTNDSERKLFEEVIRQMERARNQETRGAFGRFVPSERNRYQGQGYSGSINLYSEMSPCRSCRMIVNQFRDMFGGDIDVNVRYGVEYE